MTTLQDFVTLNRHEIISACRVKVSKRSDPPNLQVLTDHGVPMFLDQLVEELRIGLSANQQIARTARQYGNDLLRQGYTVSQVVHGYGDVCQAITEIALDYDTSISTDDFRMLSRCLDDAIASAVTQFGQQRDREIDGVAAAGSDRVAALATELQRAVRVSNVALEVIMAGSVGVAGSTGTVLRTALSTAEDVTDRLINEVNASRRPKPEAASYEPVGPRKEN